MELGTFRSNPSSDLSEAKNLNGRGVLWLMTCQCLLFWLVLLPVMSVFRHVGGLCRDEQSHMSLRVELQCLESESLHQPIRVVFLLSHRSQSHRNSVSGVVKPVPPRCRFPSPVPGFACSMPVVFLALCTWTVVLELPRRIARLGLVPDG